MRVTIVGGGNVGTQFAVHCASKGMETIVFSSKAEEFQKKLEISDENGNITLTAEIAGATFDCEKAFSKADLIFITTPAFCALDIFEKVAPYVKKGAYIGLIPGTGGMECVFKPCLDKGCVLFGLQRVPSVARLVKYGQRVCAVGYRNQLHVASLPGTEASKCAKLVEDIFDIPCAILPNYLNITLTPSNPILHTTRLYSIFRDYCQGKSYDSVPLFYEGWDNQSSAILLSCDDEVQKIKSALINFDLSGVRSLKEHYESQTEQQLTDKIRSIQGFKGLTTPSKQIDGKYYPDFSSRYFVADFSYGLEILKQIAEFAGIETPNINKVMQWYRNLRPDEKSFKYSDYGIIDYKTFAAFYCR